MGNFFVLKTLFNSVGIYFLHAILTFVYVLILYYLSKKGKKRVRLVVYLFPKMIFPVFGLYVLFGFVANADYIGGISRLIMAAVYLLTMCIIPLVVSILLYNIFIKVMNIIHKTLKTSFLFFAYLTLIEFIFSIIYEFIAVIVIFCVLPV